MPTYSNQGSPPTCSSPIQNQFRRTLYAIISTMHTIIIIIVINGDGDDDDDDDESDQHVRGI